jgi:retron-type reverse transcriptase
MKAINKLSVIRHKSKINKGWKYIDLFQILSQIDIWRTAYQNITNNQTTLTLEIENETLNVLIIKRLMRLRDKVLNESYQFKTVNEIEITKSNRRKKLLGLRVENDKIVQEVISMILEAIYDQCFFKESFRFRQRLRPHDVLKYIKSKFYCIDWILETNIETGFQIINTAQLCKIISKKIQDVRFMNLLHKSLKYEILRQKKLTRSSFGVYQESRISQIVTNIYFHELDEWVNKKAKILNQYRFQHNKKYKKLYYKINKIEEQIQKLKRKVKKYKIHLKKLKTLQQNKIKVPTLAKKLIYIKYIRYANDWIIGVKGNANLAKELKAEVTYFVKGHLKQTIHPIKIKIINFHLGKTKFLGYELYLTHKQIKIFYSGSNSHQAYRTNPIVKFDIPMNSVLQILEKRGYIKKLVKGHRSISKASFTTFEDIVIINHFTKVWREIKNHYSKCSNLSRLRYIHYLLHLSCAMTLSHRHRSSLKKIFIKHGKILKVSNGTISNSFLY